MSRPAPPPPPPPPPATASRTAVAWPQTGPAPVATRPPDAVGAPMRGVEEGLQRVRRGLHGTPGRMRLISTALVVAGLAVGLAAAQSFQAADMALDRAAANAAQIVRLQDIQTNLVRADAGATNAFLVGGLEPAEQRQGYEDAVQRAAGLVALAAAAQSADGEALAALNTSMQRYTAGVAQARANNRQGLPVGAQYLRSASSGLRADSLPILEILREANETRAQAEFAAARRASLVVVLVGVGGLAGVVAASVWLARRTHRYVNLPVAGAGVVIAATLAVGGVVLGSVAGTVDRVRTGPYATARALSDARIAAFDAKANEALTLIARGSGAAYEAAWVASADVTSGRLADATTVGAATLTELEEQWAAYTSAHAEIRALDDAGSWEAAVEAATSLDEGSAGTAFGAFDAASATHLETASEETSAALRSAAAGLPFWGWLGVLAGIGSAALAWWGMAKRIEEYR